MPSSRRLLVGLLLAFAPLAVLVALFNLLGGTDSDAVDPQEQFQAGKPWRGQGEQGISQEAAQQFADYPLLWLGESHAGYHLQAITHSRYDAPPGAPAAEAEDSVTLIYGDCRILDGASACMPPISLTIEPVCATRPESFEGSTPAGTVRGDALLHRFPRNAGLRLWTGAIGVRIHAPVDDTLDDRIVQDLRGLNAAVAAGIQPGSALPAPDFSACGPLVTQPAGP